MTFLAPAGLLALLALPAIVVLHLFRRRLRERRVAALFLFEADALPARAGRTPTRLLASASFWLEMLAALALALLFGGLALARAGTPTHLVLVLDDTASVGGAGTADRLRAWAERRLEDLPGGATATVVLTGPVPEIRVGPRASPQAARGALAAWAPRKTAHASGLALELAREVAGEGGEVVFLTDRPLPSLPPGVALVARGRPAWNAAVASALRLAHAKGERVQADLLLFGETPQEVAVRLEAVGPGSSRVLSRETLSLAPGAATRLAFDVPATGLPLVVRLDGDALAIDDAWTLLPARRPVVPVHLGLDGDARARLRLERVLAATGATRLVPRPEEAALRFVSRPGRLRGAAIEVVVGPVGEEKDAWAGPYLLERRRALGGEDAPPLLEGVTLDGVVWTAGRGEVRGLPLASAGDVVLLAEEEAGRAVRLHMNLDVAGSNLAASPDWPILVANLVDAAARRLPGPASANVRVGEEIRWRRASEGDAPVLVLPEGTRREGRGVHVLAWTADRPGIYRFVAGAREVGRVAASFLDPAESDLSGGAQADVAAAPLLRRPGQAPPAPARPLARLLALVALLAVVLDVWVLARPGGAGG